MKKMSALLMSLLMVVSLAACGSQGSGSSVSGTQPAGGNAAVESMQETSGQSGEINVESETASATENSDEVFTDSSGDGAAEDLTEATASNTEAEVPDVEGIEGKTLVVYYSATGNTEEVANYIVAATNADILKLEPVEPYSSEDLNWRDESSRVVYEHDNPDARKMELVAATVDDWESYDIVFIGYAGGIIGLNQEKPINQGFALV